ncbi:MAG: hypothetical protein SGI97_03935 [candidate division Zixibacteria bacterium]|nr:hypothetical protein [candidate division Zixibacteria bacterium]
MDIFAHALWTNLACQKAEDSTRYWAIAYSVAADMAAFAPALIHSFAKKKISQWKKVDPSSFEELNRSIPWWVYLLYDITHSIPLWSLAFGLAWALLGEMPWQAFGWLGHILVDIPTHSKRFFPTPFLWPISRFTVDGISWGVPWFMRLNYGLLAISYLILWVA